MSFKNLMVIKATVSLGFGVLMLAIPATLLSLFGVSLGNGGMFTAREYGAALIGNMAVCWIARDAKESVATKAIIVGLFVYDLIGFIMTTITMLYGAFNLLGWFIVIVYLFFTVGFGYFILNPIAKVDK